MAQEVSHRPLAAELGFDARSGRAIFVAGKKVKVKVLPITGHEGPEGE
jgi:hypothetical protein